MRSSLAHYLINLIISSNKHVISSPLFDINILVIYPANYCKLYLMVDYDIPPELVHNPFKI